MVKLNKGNVSRRKFLKTSGAASAAAVVGPWVISPKALAASGEVNVLMWSDYLPPDYLAEFTAETGITVNYTGIGSNEEIINKMKATKGKGVDICSPTNVRSGQWVDLELLQPWDYSRIPNLANVNPAMLKVGDSEWNFEGCWFALATSDLGYRSGFLAHRPLFTSGWRAELRQYLGRIC